MHGHSNFKNQLFGKQDFMEIEDSSRKQPSHINDNEYNGQQSAKNINKRKFTLIRKGVVEKGVFYQTDQQGDNKDAKPR